MKVKNAETESGPPVFIGGSGRSGTTILARVLGNHPEIFTLPTELRLITDPDGILSLKNALVDHWSFFQADLALERFMKLLQNFSRRYVGRYPLYHLDHLVGKRFYQEWSKDFVSAFSGDIFKSAWAARVNLSRKVMLYLFGKNRWTEFFLKSCYYCSPLKEEQFLRICRKHLTELFQRIKENKGAGYIVDHTPSNIIHADFLLKIFPGMKLIHIYRDPRDVLASFSGQEWGSADIKKNLRWLADILARWEEVKKRLPPGSYYEIQFETFIREYDGQIKGLCEYLGIDFVPRLLDIDLSRHNIGRWKKNLSADTIDFMNNQYGSLIEKYGFRSSPGQVV